MPDYTSKAQNASQSRSKYGVFRSIVLAFSNKKKIYSIYGQKAKSTNAISKLGFSRMQWKLTIGQVKKASKNNSQKT